jgi:hypothetical protein
MMLTHTHVICGMGVEVAGTKHVTAARFDVASGHIEIGFRSLFLRGGSEIDEASGETKQRKHKDTRDVCHLPSEGSAL